MTNFDYNEDKNLTEILNYIESTYGQHYVGNKTFQVVDMWESLGSLETTARDNAIKYLSRYGRKAGKNRKDLLKAVHYVLYMMYCNDKENAQ